MYSHLETKQEIKLDWDSGDSWGSSIMVFMTIAIELDIRGEDIPDEWQYSAGACGPVHDESYFASMVWIAETEDLLYFGNVLHRLTSILKTQGKDY